MKTKPVAVILVMVCTVFISVAQILFKYASFGFSMDIMALLGNQSMVAGIGVYAIAAVLLLLAFRHGELSVLYPIVATSYVWVSLLSPVLFPTDSMSMMKWAGILFIIAGVSFVNRGGKHD